MEQGFLKIGASVEKAVMWLTENFSSVFDVIKDNGNNLIEGFENILLFFPFYVIIIIMSAIALYKGGKGVALLTTLGLLFIYSLGFWTETMQTLAMVLISTITALVIAVPVGIISAKKPMVEKAVRPILDLMQTMPAFVYLIPAVLFFSIGKLPGAFATIIFAMPPAVRLTSLGIKEVSPEVVEAAKSFGASPMQVLIKVELPLAKNSLLAGVNQTIMMSLSMVVIAGMIAAGGLGEKVLEGINNLDIALGFESGLAVVILAIILDRITQSFAGSKK
ncbi:proline/glycine betaine ABC transporter permease [Halosquirtibacter laminarini]|uniref:Proline/glycine betaine ABC transporter permease n=1 Tax=Halosquirtibacter laminarini TaxID=3374600 RepID=A0AC61NH07_9BACT|nr:proline/glycine betaine ABC transporter permease [Prolixibacteraceae bacterium]